MTTSAACAFVMDQNANVIARHDFLPFGEEVSGTAYQNPNSIANSRSYSVTYQSRLVAGLIVTKSLDSGGPVVGPSVDSKVPVSGVASHNICLLNCGCGG
jgi:hypothetical protein